MVSWMPSPPAPPLKERGDGTATQHMRRWGGVWFPSPVGERSVPCANIQHVVYPTNALMRLDMRAETGYHEDTIEDRRSARQVRQRRASSKPRDDATRRPADGNPLASLLPKTAYDTTRQKAGRGPALMVVEVVWSDADARARRRIKVVPRYAARPLRWAAFPIFLIAGG